MCRVAKIIDTFSCENQGRGWVEQGKRPRTAGRSGNMHKRAGRATRLGRARARPGLGKRGHLSLGQHRAPAPTFATRPSAMASKNPNPRQIEMVKTRSHSTGGSVVVSFVIMAHTPATKETTAATPAHRAERHGCRWAPLVRPAAGSQVRRHAKSTRESVKVPSCKEGGREVSSPCISARGRVQDVRRLHRDDR